MNFDHCELTEAKEEFYDAPFKRSKVNFDQYIEPGRILHKYASILMLLLQLHQCCSHPFLMISRGDIQEFYDVNKLARLFLKGGEGIMEGQVRVPLQIYPEEVVEVLQKQEIG
ncbi:hypothetical protein ACH5RR_015438 [Cinchona calisaya]|uniref:Uncharacterized protein n=1 Tax=Cinchona calisaya TaxID=153742 RepID=A0ABD2ZU01_9GENT